MGWLANRRRLRERWGRLSHWPDLRSHTQRMRDENPVLLDVYEEYHRIPAPSRYRCRWLIGEENKAEIADAMRIPPWTDLDGVEHPGSEWGDVTNGELMLLGHPIDFIEGRHLEMVPQPRVLQPTCPGCGQTFNLTIAPRPKPLETERKADN